ncbi:complement component C8 beta chain [Heteronotia binoei]|uniref:complement component C8 beta chain n=1 Tax=Heteronotia binoei TaxID=13085 RepID=UPI00293088B7|nr:complement component C8 beta chain [Heteronotia binoei]
MTLASISFFLCLLRIFLICAILGFLNLHCSSGEKEISFHLNEIDGNATRSRWHRSPNNMPQPIDCIISSWSSWSMCDPCQKKRYRFAYVEQPSQFGGDSCDYSDKETEDCVPDSPCRNTIRCEGFLCGTGRCIDPILRCDGEDGCGDYSDEINCKKAYNRCNREAEQYWGIQMLANGLNIFTNNLEGLVLDNSYYGPSCVIQYIANIRFRKPYNVESYSAETKGTFRFKFAEHESYSSFEEHVSERKAMQESSSCDLLQPSDLEVSYSQDDYRYKKFIQLMKRFSSKSSKFIHAHSELEVAKYRVKKIQYLMLHYEFFQRLLRLPLEYSYGEYRELYRDYGTHYITEATLGGTYDYTLIMNGEELQKAGYALSDVKFCTHNGIKVGRSFPSISLTGDLSFKICDAIFKEIGDSKAKRKFVEDFVALVRGGASEYVTALASKDLPTSRVMREWGEAVEYNPEILRMKVEPLSELVTATSFVNATTLKENMRRALEEFQQETSSCRCSPCQGNGTPILKGTCCECLCPLGHQGVACEITQRTDVAVDGRWSCWSSWSACSGGERRRSRECNNPSAQNGGKPCSGPNTETVNC